MSKTKIWLIVGLFLIAAIIAFAIYKGVGTSKNVTTTTGGGSTTETTGGIPKLGWFDSVLDYFKGDKSTQE